MSNKPVLLKGAEVFTGEGPAHVGSVRIEQGKIVAVGAGLKAEGAEVVDLKGVRLTPGMIDLHFQGVFGHDIWEKTPESYRFMSKKLAEFGVTGFMVTTMYHGVDELGVMADLLAEKGLYEGAQALGIYMESPFVNEVKRGGIALEALRAPSVEKLEAIIRAARGTLKMMTVAPELPGALKIIGELAAQDIVPAVGHTNASYEETAAAIEAGARHATHLMNAMSPLHHREPGAVAALLLDERVSVEVIVDKIHIHPGMVRLAWLLKGVEKMAIITDSVKAAGLEDGDYMFGDSTRLVRMKDGAPRLADGTLAGSSLTLDRGLVNTMEMTGCQAWEAGARATRTPAEVLGLGERKGRIAAGYDADLVVFDEGWRVRGTMIGGRMVYEKKD